MWQELSCWWLTVFMSLNSTISTRLKTLSMFGLIVTPRWEKKGTQVLVLSPAYANDLNHRSPSQLQGLLIWFWFNQICGIKVRGSNKDWQSGRGTGLLDSFLILSRSLLPAHFLPHSHACQASLQLHFCRWQDHTWPAYDDWSQGDPQMDMP